MNKEDLARGLAEGRMTITEAREVVDEVFDTIASVMSEGEVVSISNFGKFEPRHRAARKGRNPATGAAMEIPAKTVPAFKAAKRLKEQVNGE